ncbi:hypothetical protein DXG01_009112, partial [Tephrocybe rancida]
MASVPPAMRPLILMAYFAAQLDPEFLVSPPFLSYRPFFDLFCVYQLYARPYPGSRHLALSLLHVLWPFIAVYRGIDPILYFGLLGLSSALHDHIYPDRPLPYYLLCRHDRIIL